MGGSFAALADVGKVRSTNEDAAAARALSHGQAFLVVADGVGGAPGGEVASGTAVAAVADGLLQYEGHPAPSRLDAAIRMANERVLAVAEEQPEHRGMATTLIAAVIEPGADECVAWVAHLGDSRGYVCSAGTLLRLTADHSWVEAQVREGRMDIEEARRHPRRNVITRAIGIGGQVDLDTVVQVRLAPGSVLLLCSDGLHGMVDDRDLAECLARGGTAQEIVRALVDLANAHGGRDNIGVAVYVA